MRAQDRWWKTVKEQRVGVDDENSTVTDQGPAREWCGFIEADTEGTTDDAPAQWYTSFGDVTSINGDPAVEHFMTLTPSSQLTTQLDSSLLRRLRLSSVSP
jgi:hypothetical protein